MSKFIGFCSTRTTEGWDPDVVGRLIVEEDGGWRIAAIHVSSSESFSEHDVENHFKRQSGDADTFEWVGKLDVEEALHRYPPAPTEGETE